MAGSKLYILTKPGIDACTGGQACEKKPDHAGGSLNRVIDFLPRICFYTRRYTHRCIHTHRCPLLHIQTWTYYKRLHTSTHTYNHAHTMCAHAHTHTRKISHLHACTPRRLLFIGWELDWKWNGEDSNQRPYGDVGIAGRGFTQLCHDASTPWAPLAGTD